LLTVQRRGSLSNRREGGGKIINSGKKGGGRPWGGEFTREKHISGGVEAADSSKTTEKSNSLPPQRLVQKKKTDREKGTA